MSWIDGFAHRVRTLLNPGTHERELREEMGFHEELDTMQQRDATRARRRFGNRTYYQEETRRMTWLGSLDVLRQDAGYAWRSIRRSPGFTLTIVVTLALGIGLNAASFTLLDEVYLRPPAGVENPWELRRLWIQMSPARMSDRKTHTGSTWNYPFYSAVAGAVDPRTLALYRGYAFYLGEGNKGQKVHGVLATASYFPLLGARMALGRYYTAHEDSLGNGSRVAVVSHRFWRSTLGADSGAVGQTLQLGTTKYEIIGVAAPGFNGLDMQAADVWLPLAAPPLSLRQMRNRWWDSTRVWAFELIVRPAPGMSDEQLEQRVTHAAREADKVLFPKPDPGMRVLPGSIIEARGPGDPRQNNLMSTRLFGVAVIVLIIACANVVNLLLARAVRRRREIAVRLALGISRLRLVRLLTTEMLLIALIAGAAAVLAGWWGGSLFRSLLFANIDWYESALNWRVFIFSIGVAVLAGLVAGIVPALQSSNPKLARALKDGGADMQGRRSRLRSVLVVAQAALSVTLLVGAALFVRSLANVRNLDIGFDADRLLFASAQFPAGQQQPRPEVAATMQGLAERLESHPGIERVARASMQPMSGISFMTFYWGPGGADSSGSIRGSPPSWSGVSANYFQTVGMPVVRGSVFSDGGNTPQMVVNEEMAEMLWPRGDAIGQCMRFQRRTSPCYTIVGIVGNARRDRIIERRPWPQYYLPVDQLPDSGYEGTMLIVRARKNALRGATAELTSMLRSTYPAAEPRVQAMTENLEPQYQPWQLGATLFSAFGLLALVVAVVGIYSTVSYDVSQRTQEFGVRVALGARVYDVLSLVVGGGMRLVAAGVVVGLGLAIAGGQLIAALLYDIEPYDPQVMLSVAVSILIVAAAAALIPAWRAARVDPVTALRAE